MRAAERMPAPIVGLPGCPETLHTREQSTPRMILNADPRGGSGSISTTSGLLQQREPAGRRAPICGRSFVRRGRFRRRYSSCWAGRDDSFVASSLKNNLPLCTHTCRSQKPHTRCDTTNPPHVGQPRSLVLPHVSGGAARHCGRGALGLDCRAACTRN